MTPIRNSFLNFSLFSNFLVEIVVITFWSRSNRFSILKDSLSIVMFLVTFFIIIIKIDGTWCAAFPSKTTEWTFWSFSWTTTNFQWTATSWCTWRCTRWPRCPTSRIESTFDDAISWIFRERIQGWMRKKYLFFFLIKWNAFFRYRIDRPKIV